jgi:hypothetical protein
MKSTALAKASPANPAASLVNIPKRTRQAIRFTGNRSADALIEMVHLHQAAAVAEQRVAKRMAEATERLALPETTTKQSAVILRNQAIRQAKLEQLHEMVTVSTQMLAMAGKATRNASVRFELIRRMTLTLTFARLRNGVQAMTPKQLTDAMVNADLIHEDIDQPLKTIEGLLVTAPQFEAVTVRGERAFRVRGTGSATVIDMPVKKTAAQREVEKVLAEEGISTV